MLYRIAICDDIKEFGVVIEEKIKNFFERKNIRYLIDYYESGFSLLHAMEKYHYEIIFLDMEMPEINGIETGLAIRKLDQEVKVIYVTAHSGYALDSYAVHAFDYLLKPIDNKKMEQTLEEVLQTFNKSKVDLKTLSFLENRMLKTIDMKQIIYLEKEKTYVRIHCEKESYLTTEYLADLLAKLDEEEFVQTHQGFVVRLAQIHSVQKEKVVLLDGRTIPISRKQKEQVKNKFFESLRR